MNTIPNFFILIYLSLADHPIVLAVIGFIGLMYTVSGHRNQASKKPKPKLLSWAGYVSILMMFLMMTSIEVRGLYQGKTKHQTHRQADEDGLTNSENFKIYLIGKTELNLPTFEHQWYQSLLTDQNQQINNYQKNLQSNPADQ